MRLKLEVIEILYKKLLKKRVAALVFGGLIVIIAVIVYENYENNKRIKELNLRATKEENFCERLLAARFARFFEFEVNNEINKSRLERCVEDRMQKPEVNEITKEAIIQEEKEKSIIDIRKSCAEGGRLVSSPYSGNLQDHEIAYKQWMRRCMEERHGLEYTE